MYINLSSFYVNFKNIVYNDSTNKKYTINLLVITILFEIFKF